MRIHTWLSLVLLLPACALQTQQNNPVPASSHSYYHTIGDIPLPDGYARVEVETNSFADWLRREKLKSDKRVYFNDGSLKPDQSIQFAVLDEPVGNKDLQQCADAIIRLRAEYFLSKNEYDSIRFNATDGTTLSFSAWRKGTRYRLSVNKLKVVYTSHFDNDIFSSFNDYLETVFRYAGTWSLASA